MHPTLIAVIMAKISSIDGTSLWTDYVRSYIQAAVADRRENELLDN